MKTTFTINQLIKEYELVSGKTFKRVNFNNWLKQNNLKKNETKKIKRLLLKENNELNNECLKIEKRIFA